MTEQFKVAVALADRVDGWLYDANSGLCMGIASDEMRKKYPPDKQPFSMAISGCPHLLLIHKGPRKIVTDPALLFQWTYTRSRGDIEVLAPDEEAAADAVKATALIKHYNPKKLKKTGGTLSAILTAKKEVIK